MVHPEAKGLGLTTVEPDEVEVVRPDLDDLTKSLVPVRYAGCDDDHHITNGKFEWTELTDGEETLPWSLNVNDVGLSPRRFGSALDDPTDATVPVRIVGVIDDHPVPDGVVLWGGLDTVLVVIVGDGPELVALVVLQVGVLAVLPAHATEDPYPSPTGPAEGELTPTSGPLLIGGNSLWNTPTAEVVGPGFVGAGAPFC